MSRYSGRLLILLFLFSMPVMALSQITVTGKVSDDVGRPLQSVMIRASIDGKEGPYTLSDKAGSYKLTLASEDGKISIRFSRLGFETEKRDLADNAGYLDVTMAKSASTLREVTVKAPDVKIIGDTISYLLSAFAGKGDLSLKDALKKVPGVDVAASGEISYNGKKISNFYIEGMNLLGGQYDIATTNIPASYVSAVEILNNHQDVKIDRRIFNDNVAINVRLKSQAMFRPTGTYTLSAGYGEQPLPLEATGAGMMFRDDFQSILTFKGSDIEEFSEREHHRFLSEGDLNLPNTASNVLGHLSASNPPLERKRWIKPVDASTSVNFVSKISDDVSFRTNASYSFRKTNYDYSVSQLYFDGMSDILIEQISKPESHSHTPSLSVEYKVNSDRLYFVNNFSGKGSFSRNTLPVKSNDGEISQHQRMDDFSIGDELSCSWKRDKLRWNLTSSIGYLSSPKAIIEMTERSESEKQLSQTARSHSFMIEEALSGRLEIKRSSFFLPLLLSYTNEKVRTALSEYPDGESNIIAKRSRNIIDGSTLRISISPEYYYASPYDRFVFRINCRFGSKYLNLTNAGTSPMKNRGTHLQVDPSLYLIYKMSAKSTIMVTASHNSVIGDILDMLTAPVMTDYLSMSYHSGQLSKVNTFTSSLNYKFKLPISLWYLNAEVTYTNTKNNLLSSQDVNAGLIATTDIHLPHHTDVISGQLGISKNIREINSKVALKASYNSSRNEILQNELLVTYYGSGGNLRAELSSRPLDWLEVGYDGTFSRSTSRFLDRKQSFTTQSHNASLAFYPVSRLQIKMSADITKRELIDRRYKTNSLFDIRCTYKFRKFRFTLNLRNIFNCKSYSYTIFNGLDRFTYDYILRGRELIGKVEFSL